MEAPARKRRRLSADDRADIEVRYTAWVAAGRKPAESPIKQLMEEYGVHRSYFSILLRKKGTAAEHRLSMEDKVDINQRYMAWVLGGREPSESPIKALMEEYGVHRNYFSALLRKVKKHGTVDNRFHKIGRPLHDWDFWGPEIREVIRAQRKQHKTAPLTFIEAELQRKHPGAKVPSRDGIHRWKRENGFQPTKQSSSAATIPPPSPPR